MNTIIPKTKTLFNLIKPYINKLSFTEVVSKLEPFLIYQDDISYKQYETINRYLNEKIREYKKEYLKKSREFSQLGSITTNEIQSSLLDLFNMDESIKDTIIDSYELSTNMSNSQIFSIINNTDNCKLFAIGINYDK